MHHHPRSPLLDQCPATLPQQAYLSPDWFARERKAIWAQNWIYAGRLNDLAPMTMKRIEIAGDNLIVFQDEAGKVRAFHNTCRHRGAEICAADMPMRAPFITCPYHQWAYDLNGRLISTAFATPTSEFRKQDNGLYPVATLIWNGFIYLCLADNPPIFAPDAGLQAFDNWPMHRLITGHRLETVLACNWKIFWENYNECLHCPGIHPELCDLVPTYRKGIMSPSDAQDWSPDKVAPHGLKEGAQSWTMTGAPCGPEFPDLTPEQRAAGFLFATILPSQFIVAHCDYVRSVSLTPLGPEKTRLTAEWLFSPETLALPGFNPNDVAAFAAKVLMQDGTACEMNQRGLRSSRYERGTLMPQEFDLANFHAWVTGQVEGPT